jgi:integrase
MAKKRGQGEGHVYERPDGRWEAKIRLGSRDGRPHRPSFYGATAAEVQDKLLKARSDFSRGLPVSIEHQTVKEFLDRWLEESVKPSVRPATHQQYHQHVRLYLGPLLGKLDSRNYRRSRFRVSSTRN